MATRRLGYGILDALSGLPLFATAPLYRRWHLRWGATDEEVRGPMPGDEMVRKASFNATRAITIDAPPEMVWPWIVQMGYRRAGFYIYALLDNAGYESADRVLDEYQTPKGARVERMAPVEQAGQHVGVEIDSPCRRSHASDLSAEVPLPLGEAGIGALHPAPSRIRRLRDDAKGVEGDQGARRADGAGRSMPIATARRKRGHRAPIAGRDGSHHRWSRGGERWGSTLKSFRFQNP